MTDAQRESIINQIDLQLSSTMTQEAEQKQNALEEAKKLVGAFPSLSGSPAPESSISPASQHQYYQNQTLMNLKMNQIAFHLRPPTHYFLLIYPVTIVHGRIC
jgi:hypothetical protein